MRESLQPLLEEKLVNELPGGRYLDGFIALDAGDFLTLTAETRGKGARAAEVLLPHLPALEAAWMRTAQPESGFTWAVGIWPVVALLVCHSAVWCHSKRQGIPLAIMHPSGHQYLLGSREQVAAQDEPWRIFFNSNGPADDRLHYGFMWNPGLRRVESFFPDARNRVLDAVSKGAADVRGSLSP